MGRVSAFLTSSALPSSPFISICNEAIPSEGNKTVYLMREYVPQTQPLLGPASVQNFAAFPQLEALSVPIQRLTGHRDYQWWNLCLSRDGNITCTKATNLIVCLMALCAEKHQGNDRTLGNWANIAISASTVILRARYSEATTWGTRWISARNDFLGGEKIALRQGELKPVLSGWDWTMNYKIVRLKKFTQARTRIHNPHRVWKPTGHKNPQQIAVYSLVKNFSCCRNYTDESEGAHRCDFWHLFAFSCIGGGGKDGKLSTKDGQPKRKNHCKVTLSCNVCSTFSKDLPHSQKHSGPRIGLAWSWCLMSRSNWARSSCPLPMMKWDYPTSLCTQVPWHLWHLDSISFHECSCFEKDVTFSGEHLKRAYPCEQTLNLFWDQTNQETDICQKSHKFCTVNCWLPLAANDSVGGRGTGVGWRDASGAE